MNLKRSGKFFKSFTLIEILVVVFIISLLAGLIVVNTTRARVKARDARRKADLGTVSSALAQFYADYRVYPPANSVNPQTGYTNMVSTLSTYNFISSSPRDPLAGHTGYGYSVNPSGCNNVAPNFCTAYFLQALLEDTSSGPTIPPLTYGLKNGEETSTVPPPW